MAKEAGSSSGSWRTSTVEVARGPMLAVTEPGVHIVTVMVSTQLLKTALIENVFGYFAALDPGPMLIVQPKEDAAEQFSKERIGPLINSTPALKQIVGSSKTRNADETLLYKAFPGGFLALVGAGSPDNLARRPVRVVCYDEVDKYPITREGDPIDIGDERMASFPNWLSIRACSPTVKDESRIEASYLASDQRRASLACPGCDHRQFPEFFKHVEWDKSEDGKTHKTETARIHCEACGLIWSEGQRRRALATARWHQTRPFECCGERQVPLDAYSAAWRASDPAPVETIWDWWSADRYAVYRVKCGKCGTWAVDNEHAGFQASKLYSPWAKDTPAWIAKKWIAAEGDENKKQVWYNTQAGLTYRRHGGREISTDALAGRCTVWPAEVPDGVAILTAGIDTQDYRVEIEVVGWGRNEESWSIDYHVIDGEFSDPATQQALDEYLRRIWYRADGRGFEVSAACQDSGGHHTDAVYGFAKARLSRKIWAIKGESARTGFRNPVWPIKRPTSRSKKSFRPVIIGVNAAKDFVRAALHRERPGPSYMHFNTDTDVNRFAQLTAERIEITGDGAHRMRKWVPIPGRANEALDCRVYAYAALHGLMHMGFRLNRRADEVGADVTPIFIGPEVEAGPEPDAQPDEPTETAMPSLTEPPSAKTAPPPTAKPIDPPQRPKPKTGFSRRLA
nr:terminase gpA endonuclease subunit [Sphingomonas sp. BE137]